MEQSMPSAASPSARRTSRLDSQAARASRNGEAAPSDDSYIAATAARASTDPAADFKKKLAASDANSVKAKIAIWQAQGAGVKTKPWPKDQEDEVGAVSGEGQLEEHSGDDEYKTHGTPKKRVISDGHWRKGRAASGVDATADKSLEKKQTGKAIRERMTSEGWERRRLKGGLESKEDDVISERITPEGWQRRRRPRSAGASGDNSQALSHSDTPPQEKKILQTLTTRKLSTAEPKNWKKNSLETWLANAEEALRTSSGEDSEDWRAAVWPKHQRAQSRSHGTANSSKRDSPSKRSSQTKRQSQDRHVLQPDPSPEPSVCTATPSTYDQRQVEPPRRTKASRKSETTSPAPRIPTIESWLDNTPDPFIEKQAAPLAQSQIYSAKAESHPLYEYTDGTPSERTSSPKMAFQPPQKGSADRPRSQSHAFGNQSHTRAGDDDLREPMIPVDLRATLPHSQSETSLPPQSSTLKRRGARRRSPSKQHPNTPYSPSHPQEDPIDRPSRNISATPPFLAPTTEDTNDHKRGPPIYFKRPFPTTGQHELSTIASMDTLRTKEESHPVSDTVIETSRFVTVPPQQSHAQSDLEKITTDQETQSKKGGLKRRLTKHNDLMSVLSMPETGNKSIRSARSIRTQRSRMGPLSLDGVMKELASDELKYSRELRTLVDSIIPVLISCVLSKSDSAMAAGLFGWSQGDDNITQPVIEMGVALERLKGLHKTIPLKDTTSFIAWARRGHRIYSEYLKVWRMGFQDVVVNLAPPNEAEEADRRSRLDAIDEELPRNDNGDVVDANGGRVDVAFLLKRPLVRLKYLAKTLRGINQLKPSADAQELASQYQELVVAARRRLNEEQGRLEDESAASIDATRARDPSTLAPVEDTKIERDRHVRARDNFNLELHHTSGQRVDCRVELLLRDDPPEKGKTGDLLICEIESTGRWLLFPPISLNLVSARNGDLRGEIVVMLRGAAQEYTELLSLKTEDENVGFEWVQMLGLQPVPPSIVRIQSFRSTIKQDEPLRILDSRDDQSSLYMASGALNDDIQIPIGESTIGRPSTPTERDIVVTPPSSSSRKRLQKKYKGFFSNLFFGKGNDDPYLDDDYDRRYVPGKENSPESTSTLDTRRPYPHQKSRSSDNSPVTDHLMKNINAVQESEEGSSLSSPTRRSEGEELDHLLPPALPPKDASRTSPIPSRYKLREHASDDVSPSKTSSRPQMQRNPSSVPSMDLPSIPKLRTSSNTASLHNEIQKPTSLEHGVSSYIEDKDRDNFGGKQTLPHGYIDRRSGSKPDPMTSTPGTPGAVGKSKSPHSHSRSSTVPSIVSPSSGAKTVRRPSSPLKHQYEPSTASSVSSDDSGSDQDEISSISDSDDDENLEDGDVPTPLLPLGALQRFGKGSPHGSLYSFPNATLKPSDSASQAPYKAVPHQPMQASKAIASIYSWSEKGFWESLHPDECSIVVSPGLIEAYELNASHSRPFSQGNDARPELSSTVNDQPLVALELTPLVPLRRGTALDISIRSPPTAQSRIQSGNNVMFRSRNPEECDALYALINSARINNPTYIALQNARGPYDDGMSSFNRIEQRRSKWWNFGRKNSYRAPGQRMAAAPTSESSVNSVTSAFSALRRFSHGGNVFNLRKPTLASGFGSTSNSLYSSSSGSADVPGSGAVSPPATDVVGKPPPTIGLTNAKIRLYQRESASKWRDMGSARLTISRPPPRMASFQSGLDGRQPILGANEKRIVILGKTKRDAPGHMPSRELFRARGQDRHCRLCLGGHRWPEWRGRDGGSDRGRHGGAGPGVHDPGKEDPSALQL